MGTQRKSDTPMPEEAIEKEDELTARRILGGRYRIEALVGQGGMAKVYSAHDQKLRIGIALKILDEKHYSDKEFVKRFYREAQAAARLNHKNIARVYDVNEINGLHCICMEFAEGKTLDKIMGDYSKQEQFFPINEATSIIRNVLEALGYAHKKGIIHRDINPRNIIVTEKGEVKITDFGLAKIITDDQAGFEQTVLTQPFTVMGTAQYISPEQAKYTGPEQARLEGMEISGKTDVFSTGIVFYEMITGRLPFGNVKEMSITTKVTNIDKGKLKGPRAINKRIPQKLEDIILKALEKDPAKRYDASEFCKAIDAYIKGETVKVEGSIRRRLEINRREFIIKGVAGLVGVATLIGAPTIILTRRHAYETSLYSTLDRIQEAPTWEEMKPYLQELKMKLFDWVLERAKYLRRDMAAFQFMENKTVDYFNNSYFGFQFIRDLYALGLKETGNLDFLELFSHFYDLVKFNETNTYQFYLDRFKIDYDIIKLLDQVKFKRTDEFKDKMKSAIEHLMNERYNKIGNFFQYIAKNDEGLDEQVLYACTQQYLMPLLIEGFKIFNIQKGLGIEVSEYLRRIQNQTRTSNMNLIGPDGGVYFGSYIYPLSKKPQKIIFQTDHSQRAHRSIDVIGYASSGLFPIIQLYDSIEKVRNENKLDGNITLEENILNISLRDMTKLSEERKELTRTFKQILHFYRKNMDSNGSSHYYAPMTGKGFDSDNPVSLPATISYFNLLNSLLDEKNFSLSLTNQEIEQLNDERIRIVKAVFQRSNFNQRFLPTGYQSFFTKMVCNIADPTIISSVEIEKEFVEAISKIK